MELNVAQLLKASIGETREYEIDEIVTDVNTGNSHPLRGKVKLIRTQSGILVRGNLDTEVDLSCSRCLGRFHYPLTVKFEEEYAQMVDVSTGAPLPLPGEAGTFVIDERHILDLAEAVRQYSVLAIPMKPLCRENCPGLCPGCGQDLNQGPCACYTVTDSRWAKLSNLKK